MKTIRRNQIFAFAFISLVSLFSLTDANALAVVDKNETTEMSLLQDANEVDLNGLLGVEENTTKTLNVRLYRADSYYANASSSDAFVIRFTRDGYNGLDDRDVPKMNNFDENLARFHSGQLLSIENRAYPEGGENLAMFINQFSTTNYVLKFNVPDFTNVRLQLVDNYTNTTHDLGVGESIVNFTLDNSNASKAHNRFSLQFEQVSLSTVNYQNKNAVSMYPNPVNTTYFNVDVPNELKGDILIEIFNNQGRKVEHVLFKNRTSNTLKVDSVKLKKGVYFLKVQGNNKLNTTIKFIKS